MTYYSISQWENFFPDDIMQFYLFHKITNTWNYQFSLHIYSEIENSYNLYSKNSLLVGLLQIPLLSDSMFYYIIVNIKK